MKIKKSKKDSKKVINKYYSRKSCPICKSELAMGECWDCGWSYDLKEKRKQQKEEKWKKKKEHARTA